MAGFGKMLGGIAKGVAKVGGAIAKRSPVIKAAHKVPGVKAATKPIARSMGMKR